MLLADFVPGVDPMKLKEILTKSPVTIEPGAALSEARTAMRQHDIRHLPVVDQGRLVGILSDRDIASYAERTGESIHGGGAHLVSAAMRTAVQTASPEDSVAETMGRVADTRVGCVVVVAEDALVGIVTTTDLLAAGAPAPTAS
jgi:acetoin utilization protein AcuB